jgi:hypothetical protein
MGHKRTYGMITRALTARLLEELYLVREQSLQDIARSYGCTRQMIDLLMGKYGIKRRERILAVKLAKQKGKFRGVVGNRVLRPSLSQERRREVRSVYRHAVEYSVMPGARGEIFRARCVDISASGLCLYLNGGLDAKQKIVFKSGMPASRRRATVRWCNPMAGNGYKAGLIFSKRKEYRHPAGNAASLK